MRRGVGEKRNEVKGEGGKREGGSDDFPFGETGSNLGRKWAKKSNIIQGGGVPEGKAIGKV